MNDIYVGDSVGGTNNFIVHMPNDGSSSNTFVTLPANSGIIRGVLFDVVGTFGYNMLVSTTSGQIFRVACDATSTKCSKGIATVLASVPAEACGTCFEGMAVISTNVFFGNPSLAGQLIVVSETSGKVRAISPSGTIFELPGINIPNAEVVDFVPLNFGLNGDPVQGFYEAVYHPGQTGNGLFKADAGQFSSYLGDLLVTQESGSPPQIIDIHWDGSKFVQKPIGDIKPGNPEDGLLVTPDRVAPGGFVEICKASSAINPVSATAIFSFTVTGSAFTNQHPLKVPVGACSGPIRASAPTATITELPAPGVGVGPITAYGYSPPPYSQYGSVLISSDPTLGTATVGVVAQANADDTSTETVVTFTNYEAPPGQLKICKISDGSIVLGSPFTFTVTPPSPGVPQPVIVEAGPPEEGGYCEIVKGTFQVGTYVPVMEGLQNGINVTCVTVNETPIDVNGLPIADCTPIPSGSVPVRIGPGFTEVAFTNSCPKCQPFGQDVPRRRPPPRRRPLAR